MKFRVFAAVAAALLTATVAQATDLPNKKAPPAGPTVTQPWTGAYLGGTIGGFRTTDDSSLTGEAANRAIPGIFGGYNYQINSNVVVGVEGDLNYMGLNQDSSDVGSTLDGLYTGCLKINKNNVVLSSKLEADCVRGHYGRSGFEWVVNYDLGGATVVTTGYATSFSIRDLDTLRLRAGYLVQPNTLVFVTGGLGLAHASLDSTIDAVTETSSGYHSGWVVGGGIEYSYSPKWNLKVDYLHYDLGSIETSTDIVALKGNLIRAGIAYRF